ncbi:amidohydrolase family protein [Sphingopyxis sp.]|uniref:amidohydrolase family protein n=1 Tax=Sphingopyxis sp. TaxID=1908224 RepID=UPI003D6CDF88
MQRLLGLFAGLACLASSATTHAREPAKDGGGYAIVNVSVLPMRTGGVLANQTVIVRGDRIVKVGPARSVKVGRDLEVIDGKGRYLMPGLADMHVHLWDERELPLYLGNGVTFVRNMWGEDTTLTMRRRIAAGELAGPTILTAGQLIDGEPRIWAGSAQALTPVAGEALVAKQKAAGFDFIKVYSNLKPDVFDAIAAAAKREGIPFAGHVPRSVPLDHALRSGMRTIEHMTGYLEASLAEDRTIGDNSRSEAGIALAKSLASGELAYDKVFDQQKLAAAADLTREMGVWNVPTLIVLKNGALTRREIGAAMTRDELRYVSPFMQMGWNRSSRTDAEQEMLKVFAEKGPRERIAALRRAGAPILVGTDTPNPQIIAGFAVHDEMALLEEAGFTRFEVLKAATANASTFLGTPDEFGVVAAGARADLLLLEANPLDNLDNLKRRAGVMLRGRWLPEAELHAKLEEVAAGYRKAPDWFAAASPLAGLAESPAAARLQFVTEFAGKPITADRLAFAAAGDGRLIIAQTQTTGRAAGLRDYRLELDSAGALTRYVLDDHSRFGRNASLMRDGATYRLAVAGKDDQVITPAAGEVVLTDTIADGALLAVALRAIQVGETRSLPIWTMASPRGGLRLERRNWSVTRRAETADGASGFDIRIGSAGPLPAMTMWVDLAGGLPVRVEESGGLLVQRRTD